MYKVPDCNCNPIRNDVIGLYFSHLDICEDRAENAIRVAAVNKGIFTSTVSLENLDVGGLSSLFNDQIYPGVKTSHDYLKSTFSTFFNIGE